MVFGGALVAPAGSRHEPLAGADAKSDGLASPDGPSPGLTARPSARRAPKRPPRAGPPTTDRSRAPAPLLEWSAEVEAAEWPARLASSASSASPDPVVDEADEAGADPAGHAHDALALAEMLHRFD